ncbi:ABC transporter permease subunit [Streptomyces sp. 3MP-14]|uniref:ABC transporter permease subunit n=1 Tax=Streptomyces mimosae TaxID=2586635 RepID=A0A5N5ZZ58_9ACTN|nr:MULTISPECIES: sugar ABC transporter permease [Streptomyces]KAB8161222.1 ABC transporter permease subunit [Streptomyces mimosae]KAB8179033.1 ABC transporter permease subunit [Streptomyces sp. 3MP-14]
MTAHTTTPPPAPVAPPREPAARRRVPPGRGGRSAALRRNLAAYLFLAGAVVCFALFSWYPIVRGFLLSFQRVTFTGADEWVGWENFQRLLDDPLFATAWRNTGYFTLLALVFGFAAPLLTAVVLNELRHGRAFLRMAVYLPVMLPPIVTMLLWRWIYDPGPGLLNSALEVVRLPPQAWLESENLAMVSLVLVSTWANMGTTTLIYLAALSNIPGELYEAAQLDGASIRRRLWHVTLPQLRFILLITLLLQVLGTMQVFIEPFVLTGGGPDDATVTVLLLLYRYAFVYNDFGLASAMSTVLFLVLGVFAACYLRLTRTRG